MPALLSPTASKAARVEVGATPSGVVAASLMDGGAVHLRGLFADLPGGYAQLSEELRAREAAEGRGAYWRQAGRGGGEPSVTKVRRPPNLRPYAAHGEVVGRLSRVFGVDVEGWWVSRG